MSQIEKTQTNLDSYKIATNVAKSFLTVSKQSYAFAKAETTKSKRNHLTQIERELDATQYWFTLFKTENRQSPLPLPVRLPFNIALEATDIGLGITKSAISAYKKVRM